MLKTSSLLGRFILLAFLLALAVATGAASEPIGYVIYREKGFHPATQARLIEVQSLKAFAAVTKVVTVAGSPIEIQNGQKPEFIPLPAYNPTAGETAKVKIAAAIQQYPQHKSKLMDAQKAWAEYSAQYAKVSQESAAPVKQKDRITFTTPDGREFKAVEVTRVDPDGISVLTETSIQKIPFEQLPQPIQQQFRYDPVAAEAFRQKLSSDKQKVEVAKQQTEDLRVRELTTVSKPVEAAGEKSRVVTVSSRDVDLLIAKIEEQGSGTVYEAGRESPVIKGFNLFMTWQELYANIVRLKVDPFEAEKNATWIGFSDKRNGKESLGYDFCQAWFSEKDGSLTSIQMRPSFVNKLFDSQGLSMAQFVELFSKGYKIPLRLESKVSSDTVGAGIYSDKFFYRYLDPQGWSVTVKFDINEGFFLILNRTPSTSDSKFGD